MNPLVGPLALAPALVAIVLTAVLQWVRLDESRRAAVLPLAVATALFYTWAVAVAVLRFVYGI